VNDTRLPKEVYLTDCARRDKQGKKGDRVEGFGKQNCDINP